MASNKPAPAKAAPFAHLVSAGVALLGGRARAGEDEPDGDEEKPDDAEMEEDEDQESEAEGEDDEADMDDDAECDDDMDDDDKAPKDKEKAAAWRAGFAEANARARRIFASPHAAGRPDLAAQLAFGSKLSTAEAIDVLRAAQNPTARRRPLSGRMDRRRDPNPGAEGGAAAPTTLAAKMIAVGKKLGQM